MNDLDEAFAWARLLPGGHGAIRRARKAIDNGMSAAKALRLMREFRSGLERFAEGWNAADDHRER